LAAWPRAHSGVEVITRDRASAYAQAASEAAPGAVQVADRWHLLSNMRDVLERAFQQRSTAIRELLAPARVGDTAGPAAEGTSDDPTGSRDSAARARRRERFDEVRRMHREGHSIRGTAAAIGLHCRTVERYIRSDACPD
jgi:transposase